MPHIHQKYKIDPRIGKGQFKLRNLSFLFPGK